MILTIDETIEKYETLEHENMTAAAEWYQKYLNYQDHEYKAFGRKCDKEAGKYKQLADWLKELKELREQIPCEDVVSRNAIIRALNTMDRYVSDELTLCNTYIKFPKNEVFIVDDVYEEIVENLPSVQQEQQWIPVSERLPVLDEDVLATTAWNDITIAWRVGIDEWRIHEGNTNAETDDLIAWLPLPERYKPQQEGNT